MKIMQSYKKMRFKLPRGLEKTLLGVAGALVIAGTPVYTKAAETPADALSKHSLYLFSFDRPYQRVYDIPFGRKDTKKITLTAKRERNPASLEIIFEVGEPKGRFEKEEDPMNVTPVDPGFSRFVILSPKKARISEMEQEAYVLPGSKFVKLVPLEKSAIKKTILESGEDFLDGITSIFPGINPLKSLRNRFVESTLTQEEEGYLAKAKILEKNAEEEYTFNKIEFFQQPGLRNKIEKARRIKTFFNTKDLEGVALMAALLRPAIGRTSTTEGVSGDWIGIYFLMQGEKMPSWIKKQEMLTEDIITQNDVQNILKKRKTKDIGAYDPVQKRFIIYNFNEGELEEFGKSAKSSIRWISLFLSIEKDIKREKFSDKGMIFLKEKDSVSGVNMPAFYNLCRELETK